jgi:hypothetical protein
MKGGSRTAVISQAWSVPTRNPLSRAAATPAAIKWFPPEKKGLVTGLVVSGFGLDAAGRFQGAGDGRGPLVDHTPDARGKDPRNQHIEDDEKHQQPGDLTAPVLKLELRQTAGAMGFGGRMRFARRYGVLGRSGHTNPSNIVEAISLMQSDCGDAGVRRRHRSDAA